MQEHEIEQNKIAHEGAQLSPPYKLTAETTARIIELLKDGSPPEMAAAAAGVTASTFRRWLYLGARGHEPYASFAIAVEAARHSHVAKLMRRIDESTDWKAAAWTLERAHSQHFSPKQQIEVQQSLETMLMRLKMVLPPEWYERALEALCGEAQVNPAVIIHQEEGIKALVSGAIDAEIEDA